MALISPLSGASNAEGSQLLQVANQVIAAVNGVIGGQGVTGSAAQVVAGTINAGTGVTGIALGTTGPTGTHTTTQGWLQFVDNLGTVRYIPVF